MENHRVHTFQEILEAALALQGAPPQERPSTDRPTFRTALSNAQLRQLSLLGELMLQSHASYSRCKLGSPGTFIHIIK